MKNLIRTEEAFIFALSIYLFSNLEYPWWLFPALLFLPDIGMIGYLANTKIGAVIYNAVHHRSVGVVLYISGAVFKIQLLQLIGIMLFAHSTLDRVFNYGLKYKDSFKHTHLS